MHEMSNPVFWKKFLEMETLCMKCQILFSGKKKKKKKNIINLSSAELAQRVVKVNDTSILVGHFESSLREREKKD